MNTHAKGQKQFTASLKRLHEGLGDHYLALMNARGFGQVCPVVGWETHMVEGKSVTVAVLVWDEPLEVEEVAGFPVDMLVHEVCTRAVRQLTVMAGN